jgi:hypothetical protein
MPAGSPSECDLDLGTVSSSETIILIDACFPLPSMICCKVKQNNEPGPSTAGCFSGKILL